MDCYALLSLLSWVITGGPKLSRTTAGFKREDVLSLSQRCVCSHGKITSKQKQQRLLGPRQASESGMWHQRYTYLTQTCRFPVFYNVIKVRLSLANTTLILVSAAFVHLDDTLDSSCRLACKDKKSEILHSSTWFASLLLHFWLLWNIQHLWHECYLLRLAHDQLLCSLSGSDPGIRLLPAGR